MTIENPLSLLGRTMLVTGASSGIGRETAVLLSRLGASVLLVSRHPERLAETAQLLSGNSHRMLQRDLEDPDSLPAWLRELAADVGPLHGIAHCAGQRLDLPLRVTGSRHLQEQMRINVEAALALAKGFRLQGVHAPGASLVLISSVMGLVGEAGVSAYSATKGAVIALTKSLAIELAREDIRVNCVAPGAVQTAMLDRIASHLTPEQFDALARKHVLGLGTPRDVANAIAFLLADTARWITGTTLVVDGGYTAQ